MGKIGGGLSLELRRGIMEEQDFHFEYRWLIR